MTAKKKTLELTGNVLQALPHTISAVRVEERHESLHPLCGRMRKHHIRTLLGDKRLAERSVHELKRGRIMYQVSGTSITPTIPPLARLGPAPVWSRR